MTKRLYLSLGDRLLSSTFDVNSVYGHNALSFKQVPIQTATGPAYFTVSLKLLCEFETACGHYAKYALNDVLADSEFSAFEAFLIGHKAWRQVAA